MYTAKTVLPWRVGQLGGGVVDGHGSGPGDVDEVGGVVEGPVECHVRGVGHNPTDNVDHLPLPDPMYYGLLVLADWNI